MASSSISSFVFVAMTTLNWLFICVLGFFLHFFLKQLLCFILCVPAAPSPSALSSLAPDSSSLTCVSVFLFFFACYWPNSFGSIFYVCVCAGLLWRNFIRLVFFSLVISFWFFIYCWLNLWPSAPKGNYSNSLKVCSRFLFCSFWQMCQGFLA